MLTKRKPIRSQAIRDSAKDEACTICDTKDGTVVFCHLNEAYAGKGIGQKADDLGMYLCQNHHDIYDGRKRGNIEEWEILRAFYRTLRRCVDKGLILIK